MKEKERLEFVKERDGEEEMLKFAEQTLSIYVADSINRGPYEDSINAITEEFESHGYIVKFVVIEKKD